MEHFIKGIANQESQISAIPPERYGDRFVKFISGITKTREAAEREKQEQIPSILSDPQLAGVNVTHKDRLSTEQVMEQAEYQAERSRRHGASEDHVPERKLHMIRSPSAERGELGTILPVVEEAVESSSTGARSARSARSTESNLHGSQPPLVEEDAGFLVPRLRDHSHHRPPPTPPKDSGTANSEERPPTPPKDAHYSPRNSGPPTPPKEQRGRDKDLPLPPPSMEAVVRVN
jgi:1-phosphatidylinositol-4-phosphate 5-kinase